MQKNHRKGGGSYIAKCGQSRKLSVSEALNISF